MPFLQSIFEGAGLNVTSYEAVPGGDINDAWCLCTHDRKYFLKVNNAGLYPAMLSKEAKGLIALKDNCGLTVPAVIKNGVINDQQYLLLEWIEKGLPANNYWEQFGERLALMHKQPGAFFGWDDDNYIGSLCQKNTQHAAWHSFYAECRIVPLVKKLFDAGNFSKQDIATVEKLCGKLHRLFPVEQPSFLHGDLWAGNFMVGSNGNAVLYDPAVYFGHREMDIGMSLLFGGFDKKFYEAYNKTWPLQTGWQQRIQLTQLYPLLVHAVLFGGHYINSVQKIISGY